MADDTVAADGRPVSSNVDDPRTQLGSSGAPRLAGCNVSPQYFEFHEMTPTETTLNGGKLWWVRSQAMVVGYLELQPGDEVVLSDHPDEYVVLVPEPSASVAIGAGDEHVPLDPGHLAVVPSGDSAVYADTSTTVVVVASAQSADLAGRATNADFYAVPDPNVAPWQPWPAAPDGERVRVYDVANAVCEPVPIFRLFRCSTVMVNWFPAAGPRDPDALSPHHHDDFEQLSLHIDGDYIHHIRTPWTASANAWRDDEHRFTKSPAVVVIPPPSIHTSQAVGDHSHQLIDLFGPPRADFSSKPGWVLNEDDYPKPDHDEVTA